MDSWERFNETTLPNKKAFYSKLYLEGIIDEDYIHAQKVLKNLNQKIQVKIMYMFKVMFKVQSENFRNKFL